LAAIEDRLETLEENIPRSRLEETPVTAGLVPPQEDTKLSSKFHRIPEFHHGAGHKVLQYWSRLRVHLTIPNVEVLRYLKYVEDDDVQFRETLPSGSSHVQIPLSVASDCLLAWPEIISQLPISFFTILRISTFFSADRIASFMENLAISIQHNVTGVQLNDLSLEEILVYTIALRWVRMADAGAHDLSHSCFMVVLQRLWQVHMAPDSVAVPFLLVIAHVFLYVYASPFRALGILQIVDPAINRLLSHSDSR
jgi:hypothetical protein